MNGRGGGGRGGRRSRDRAHARPASAASPAAESAARVSALLERLLAQPGATVTEVARVLGVRGIDVARWRRGQPIPFYRRAELEGRIARLRVEQDPDSGERLLGLAPEPRVPSL